MSKKTIVFKMPSADSRDRDGEANDSGAPLDESAPAFARAPEAAQISNDAEPDQWVRRRSLNLAPPPGFAVKKGFTIDLAAERDWGEVVALGLIVPPMLGWFWLAHAMDRYRRIVAG